MASKKLVKSTSIVSCMTLISRILGLVRDIAIAHLFGASAGLDAFWVAFRIPNFMRRLFAEGAFSQAFVPVLSEYQQKDTIEATQSFIAGLLGTLGIILLALTIVVELSAPLVVMLFAPGYIQDPYRLHQATVMLHLTFPYLMLISFTAFFAAILNTFGRFAIPAVTPVLLNISMITAAYYLSQHLSHPVQALAWGVFIAGFAQFLFQMPFLYRLGLLIKPCFNFNHPGVKRVLTLMIPALFGVSVAQISLLVDTLFASFLPAGSISWLFFSDRLTSFPLGVFAVALATVVMPQLSRQHVGKSTTEYAETVDWAIRCVLLIALPAAIGLFLLAGPLLVTLFHSAQFTQHDVLMTKRSLLAFAIGVPAFMLVKILASAFYARQDIKTPVRYAVYAMLANIVLNLLFIFPLAHAGLALATSLSSTLNAGLLWYGLKKLSIVKRATGWRTYLGQLLIANVIMIGIIRYGCDPLSHWLAWSSISRIFHLVIIIGISIFAYFTVLHLLGLSFKSIVNGQMHHSED